MRKEKRNAAPAFSPPCVTDCLRLRLRQTVTRPAAPAASVSIQPGPTLRGKGARRDAEQGDADGAIEESLAQATRDKASRAFAAPPAKAPYLTYDRLNVRGTSPSLFSKSQ